MKVLSIDQDEVITEGGFLYAINTFLRTNYVKEEDYNHSDSGHSVCRYSDFPPDDD